MLRNERESAKQWCTSTTGWRDLHTIATRRRRSVSAAAMHALPYTTACSPNTSTFAGADTATLFGILLFWELLTPISVPSVKSTQLHVVVFTASNA